MNYQYGPGPLQFEHDKLKNCIGIVEDGNTATHAIATGQYVVWKDNLYVASTDIQVGTALSSSNLTVKTKGIGNEIFDTKEDLEAFKNVGFLAVGTVAAGATKHLASSSASYCLILTYSASTNYMGMWIAYMRASTATSSCNLKQITAPGDKLVLSVDTSKIKIANGYGGGISVCVIPLSSAKRSWYSIVD